MNRRTWVGLLGLAAVATSVAAASPAGTPETRCSLATFHGFRLSAVRFIGTATGDTALASPAIEPLAQQLARVLGRTGAFTRAPGGAVQFHRVLRPDDRIILTVRGERISLDALADR